jgi:hypothetical protein
MRKLSIIQILINETIDFNLKINILNMVNR